MTPFSIFWGNQLQFGQTQSLLLLIPMHVTVNQNHSQQHTYPTLNENANLSQSRSEDFFFPNTKFNL